VRGTLRTALDQAKVPRGLYVLPGQPRPRGGAVWSYYVIARMTLLPMVGMMSSLTIMTVMPPPDLSRQPRSKTADGEPAVAGRRVRRVLGDGATGLCPAG
jgi:hypothetical protein